jgi:nucleoside 2-deoxyribosyltransferase
MAVRQAKAKLTVYIAGPMFSDADIYWQGKLESALKKAGYATYNPHKDGLEISTVMSHVNKGLALPQSEVLDVVTFAHRLVFALDVYQLIERCGAVVFNLDGRVPDEGAVSESAIAFAADKPVVAYKTTPISELGGWDNPLVQGLASQWGYVSDVAKVPAAVAKAVIAMGKVKGAPASAGPRLTAVAELGAAVWQSVGTLQATANKSPKAIYTTVGKMQTQLKPLMDKAFL